MKRERDIESAAHPPTNARTIPLKANTIMKKTNIHLLSLSLVSALSVLATGCDAPEALSSDLEVANADDAKDAADVEDEAQSVDGEIDELRAPEADAGIRTDGEILAQVEYAPETKAIFIAIEGEDGEQTVGVLETGRENSPAIHLDEELAGSNPVEIFTAITRDQQVPELMIELYGEPVEADRGWYLDMIEAGDVVTPRAGMCTNSTFNNSWSSFHNYINDYGAIWNDTTAGASQPNWREVDPFAAGGCNYSGLTCLYEFRRNINDLYTSYNIDQYRTRVAVCDLKYHSTIHYQGSWNLDTELHFGYKTTNNAGIYTAFERDLVYPSDEGKYWQWVWNSGSSAANYDWRTRVRYALAGEDFEIAYGSEAL